ncbi:MAG TPA: hypothetical protein VGR29_09550 [Thermomicrobiales bacterium]|nr:hypothetical protein [Thermomicrobiales bacterium]
MQAVGIVILLTVFALAVIPLTIAYYLWLARTVLPRVAAALPPRSARMVLAMCIALPWFVVALAVWWFRG